MYGIMLKAVYSKVFIHLGLIYLIEMWACISSKEHNLMLLHFTSLFSFSFHFISFHFIEIHRSLLVKENRLVVASCLLFVPPLFFFVKKNKCMVHDVCCFFHYCPTL